MARNKYPELTVEKILDAALPLFLEKGYDNTTIQDIVDELGGLTKGAVYHHFKSKEEIIDALGDRVFLENNPFTKAMERKDLNGLEKMREAYRLSREDLTHAELNRQSLPLLKNPRIFVEMIDANRRLVAPMWQALMEEGNRDGSVHTPYAKELSEVLQLLTSVWFLPSVFPVTKEQMLRKFDFLGDLMEKMGVPLIDDGVLTLMAGDLEQMLGAGID